VSTTEQPAETIEGARSGNTAAALAVVLLLTVVAGLVLLTFAFRTDNTDSSVDGRTATTSSYTGADEAP
jgi:hypothetical protein